jgi:hypothetical protein
MSGTGDTEPVVGESENERGEVRYQKLNNGAKSPLEIEEQEGQQIQEEMLSKYEKWDHKDTDWSPGENEQQERKVAPVNSNENNLNGLEKNSLEIEKNPQASTGSTSPHDQIDWKVTLLTFCGISIAAILGVFTRIGFGYYKIWAIETNYVWILLLVQSPDSPDLSSSSFSLISLSLSF